MYIYIIKLCVCCIFITFVDILKAGILFSRISWEVTYGNSAQGKVSRQARTGPESSIEHLTRFPYRLELLFLSSRARRGTSRRLHPRRRVPPHRIFASLQLLLTDWIEADSTCSTRSGRCHEQLYPLPRA